MDDHGAAIEYAADLPALRRAYALALAEDGARGEAAEWRRLFITRRDELDAPLAVDEIEEADRAFGRWALRCLAGDDGAGALRADLEQANATRDERDRRRHTLVLEARDDWHRAKDDRRVPDALLRGFLARLTGAAAATAPAGSVKAVRRVQRRYPALYAVDPDWFESATVPGSSKAEGFFRRYAIWFALAFVARMVFKLIRAMDGDTP